jgi:valyl-tRNA synthetase
VQFVTGRRELAAVLQDATPDITALTRADSVAVLDPTAAEAARSSAGGQRTLAGVCGELQVLLPLDGLVDLEALRGRLEKDMAKAEKEIKGLAGRLANPNFADKAPAAVVAECRANLAEAEAQAELARRRLGDMG